MNLASNLVGRNVNGWNVVAKLAKKDECTGGAFSSGYVVKHDDGREAFLKAVNLDYAISMFGRTGRSRVDIVNDMTSAFRYERDLLDFCGQNQMDRIVVAIDSGEYSEPSEPYFIPYLVFELCPSGDLRRNEKMREPGLAWRMKVFHGVCVGLRQLHEKNLAHQDLKPSNVLVFGDDRSKIADLGRSTLKGPNAQFAAPGHMGDLSYCPIELLFGYHATDWDVRRRGADLYMLGGILAFLSANVHIFGMILAELPEVYHPMRWRGTFEDALPVVTTATKDAISKIAASVPREIQGNVGDMLSWLCHPQPEKRGHPRAHAQSHGDRFSLERIISTSATIARKASIIGK